ncbi:MAG: hypothetical protein Q8P70_01865 [bacterium]|nr:hypothetical protein [bacterium]
MGKLIVPSKIIVECWDPTNESNVILLFKKEELPKGAWNSAKFIAKIILGEMGDFRAQECIIIHLVRREFGRKKAHPVILDPTALRPFLGLWYAIRRLLDETHPGKLNG